MVTEFSKWGSACLASGQGTFDSTAQLSISPSSEKEFSMIWWVHTNTLFHSNMIIESVSSEKEKVEQRSDWRCYRSFFRTSNARRYDSLDPRLNILESLFSIRFIHASPSIRINRTIIENSLGPRWICSLLYELQSFTTTSSSSSRIHLKFSNIG